jgi:hypothetical protein
MRIFIERFVLAILAPLAMLLAVTNPMGFSWPLRIIGVTVIVVVAGIAAHIAGWEEWRWERLRAMWWLWAIFGLSGGGALALWLTPLPFGGAVVPSSPPKSAFLGFDDGQKWRFSSSLRNAAFGMNANQGMPGRISCEFALGLSTNNQFVWGVWTELQPMLDLSWWRSVPVGVGGGQHQFPAGFTILAGADKGPAFVCATALGRTLQETLAPGTPVTVRANQVTEALTSCNNNCVELDIGDFRSLNGSR